MTVAELLKKGKELLKEQKIENYQNEARWIFEAVFGCGSEYAIFHAAGEADAEKSDEFIDKIAKRASGYPVQYVIGSWDFYGESFKVGEGVLIPRPETELLVDFALDYLKKKSNPVVFDLCAGSGCIGLTVAKQRPDSKVYLFEKSSDALEYLIANKKQLGCGNAEVIHGDIFGGFKSFDVPKPDLILSNPPYIETDEVPTLQSEVLLEPRMALDGGADGLDFYRAIAEKWLKGCGCAAAVECGEGQAKLIKALFSDVCASTDVIADFNGIERVVTGTERNKNDF